MPDLQSNDGAPAPDPRLHKRVLRELTDEELAAIDALSKVAGLLNPTLSRSFETLGELAFRELVERQTEEAMRGA